MTNSMDLDQGIIWAYRLLLNREPDSEAVVAAHRAHVASPADIRQRFLVSDEYAARFENAGRPIGPPRFPVDLREGVLWGYRFLLEREPTPEHVDYQLERVQSISDIRSIFVFSPEFTARQGCGVRDLLDFEVLNRFAPFHSGPFEDGFFRDFLGTRTRVSYLPAFYHHKAGSVEGGPNTASRGIHGTAEWIGTLRSVIEARDRFVAVELGAGWAPWLVSSAYAAKQRGLEDIRLIGVEGSPEHVEFSRQHIEDNGLTGPGVEIVHAVVGAEDGIARFPRLIDPSDHYGAHAAFEDGQVENSAGFGEWDEIRSVSLATLLADVDTVDILHSDIQGAEADVIEQAIGLLNARVRRMVVGTHSRLIEGRLIDLLGANGWSLEYEVPCVIAQNATGAFHVLVDGEQVWRNGRLG